MRIVLAGGGTAGHVQPALATAWELQRRHPQWEFVFLGTATGLESRLIPEHGFELKLIPRTPMPRRPNLSLFTFPYSLAQTIKAAYRALNGADLVIGFGGYVAAPAYIAGRMRALPLIVHEQNAKAGFANRLGALLTQHVAVSFANTKLPHASLTGLPVHPKIVHAAQHRDRNAALAHFGLATDRPLLLVTGGSQGSQRINSAIASSKDRLIAEGWQILHAVGERNDLPTSSAHYRAVPYLTEMDLALSAADLLIGRSGAVTCAEAAAMALPSIFVPLPIGNGEQALNASDQVSVGGAMVIADAQLTGETLLAAVRDVRPKLARMSSALRTLPGLSGADNLARLIEGVL